MYELIPILAGVAAGLAAVRLDAPRARPALLVAVAVGAGFAAAALSGELAESWLFVLWDIAQALVFGALALVAAPRLWARRRAG